MPLVVSPAAPGGRLLRGPRRSRWRCDARRGLFLMRLTYAGRDFAWIYERQDRIQALRSRVHLLCKPTNPQTSITCCGSWAADA